MGRLNQANHLSIRMGEMSVGSGKGQLRTLLGSCVGVAFHDRHQKIGGLAHIVLPYANGKTERPGKYVDTAIPMLIQKMQELARTKLVLTAQLAGGASMFATTEVAKIGRQNVESCERLLGELQIPVIARDCGGRQGRRMSLNIDDGSVWIEMVGESPVELQRKESR